MDWGFLFGVLAIWFLVGAFLIGVSACIDYAEPRLHDAPLKVIATSLFVFFITSLFWPTALLVRRRAQRQKK